MTAIEKSAPLPWSLKEGFVMDADGVLVVDSEWTDDGPMALIVRAVNCHDQLVAALESARKGFELITTAQSRGLSIHYAEGCAESCMEAAAAALAAAKEGA